jgi:hypothetical protein
MVNVSDSGVNSSTRPSKNAPAESVVGATELINTSLDDVNDGSGVFVCSIGHLW